MHFTLHAHAASINTSTYAERKTQCLHVRSVMATSQIPASLLPAARGPRGYHIHHHARICFCSTCN